VTHARSPIEPGSGVADEGTGDWNPLTDSMEYPSGRMKLNCPGSYKSMKPPAATWAERL
jgi:hypothetical protein